MKQATKTNQSSNKDIQCINHSLIALLNHTQRENLLSYDYFDWWATRWGQQLKLLAYRTEPLGHLLFSAPLMALEWWLPFLRKPLNLPQRLYPICIAHRGLTYLELAKYTKQEAFLNAARSDAQSLLRLAVPGARGLCWGIPFTWVSNSGVIPPNHPEATQSAYGFDLFEQLYLMTDEKIYLEHMFHVARAMAEEYIDMPRSVGRASTYHARGLGDVVINALSYRVHVLARSIAYGLENYNQQCNDLANYIVSQQQPDGSWFYGEAEKNQFVDHFHTCFVIKNLTRANITLQQNSITEALDRGISYYWANLFNTYGLPQPFAQTVRFNPVRFESYDFAECVALFALLGPDKEFTIQRLRPVLQAIHQKFLLKDGGLRFRVYHFPTVSWYPYYRFGMSAMLLALAQLLNSRVIHDKPHDLSTTAS